MDASAGGARNCFIGPRAITLLLTHRGLHVHVGVRAAEDDESGHDGSPPGYSGGYSVIASKGKILSVRSPTFAKR